MAFNQETKLKIGLYNKNNKQVTKVLIMLMFLRVK